VDVWPEIIGGTWGSKAATGAKKAVTPIKKRRVPTVGVMAEVSSIESQESSPHGRAPRYSAPVLLMMPEHVASQQIGHSASGALTSDLAGRLVPSVFLVCSCCLVMC
jgi:hypothetical protein